uniref:Gp37 protein n=1 Tax=Candidatus Kentrum sp. TC TaxID=2126339 RepID=A0A450YW35_9GAMM|nr:MAG: Gp37 protein [Candidatus Kentron sp. TC]
MSANNASAALVGRIIERLKDRIPELLVDSFPDNPEGYRLKHPKGALLVRYKGSRYGESRDLGENARDRDMVMEVTIHARGLNGESGAVAYLDRALRALSGRRIAGFSPLVPVEDGFLDQGAGLWRYFIDFSARTLFVAETEAESGPLATKATFE